MESEVENPEVTQDEGESGKRKSKGAVDKLKSKYKKLNLRWIKTVIGVLAIIVIVVIVNNSNKIDGITNKSIVVESRHVRADGAYTVTDTDANTYVVDKTSYTMTTYMGKYQLVKRSYGQYALRKIETRKRL